MGKIKKFASIGIRKIVGGKDPERLLKDFIESLGFTPEESEKERSSDHVRWMVEVAEGEELEVLLEGIRTPHDTTVYLGVNIITVPIRGAGDLLAAALEIADGLVGVKVSLVGHYLVLSATLSASGLSLEELLYAYKLITAQKSWFKDSLAEELGITTTPEKA